MIDFKALLSMVYTLNKVIHCEIVYDVTGPFIINQLELENISIVAAGSVVALSL
jgi:hypothetical protein